MKISITLPCLRVEIRNPPPSKFNSRSGAVVLDVHDLCLIPGDQAPQRSPPSTRFADAEEPLFTEGYTTARSNHTSILLVANWERLTFAYQPFGESKAQMILSLGSLPPTMVSESRTEGIAIGSPRSHVLEVPQARPQVMFSKSSPTAMAASSILTTAVLTLDIPSVHVHLGKRELDGLQLWADDISQLVERAMNPNGPTLSKEKEDPNLIGSRFFNKTRRSQGSGTDSAASTITAPKTTTNSETNVKVTVTEGSVTLNLLYRIDF